MISIQGLLYWGRGGLHLVTRLGWYVIIFLWGLCQPKAALVARTLALQSQLAACLEQIDKKEAPKPRFHPAFRLLWVLISKAVDDWQDLVPRHEARHRQTVALRCLPGLLEVEVEPRTKTHP